jgi:FixJ family two-component response regulator
MRTKIPSSQRYVPESGDCRLTPKLATVPLITDINMLSMTGLELYARLVELGHKIPTILVIAYPNEAARSRAQKDGIVCYLRKPFDDNDLADCVQKAIKGGKPLGDS